jgi:hypothetical protein
MLRITFFLLCFINVFAQKAPIDYSKKPICNQTIINVKTLPKEVHFAVKITENHNVILILSHASYYDKVWTNPNMGVAIKLVPKSMFACNTNSKKVYWMPSLFLKEMNARKTILDKSLEINIGKVPTEYQSEELEGNIAFLLSGNICDNMYFANIDGNNFSLLPMGFYTNIHRASLKNLETLPDIVFESSIPFEKNKTDFNEADFESTKAFLNSNTTAITQIKINSYASVEGDFDLNLNLYQNRAKNILSKIKENTEKDFPIEINASENWTEFYDGIENTAFAYLKNKNQSEIKELLKNKSTQSKIDFILNKSRNTKILIYGKNTDYSKMIDAFNESIRKKEVARALSLQQQLFSENENPEKYSSKIEIPQLNIFADLLNDEILYKNELKLIDDKKSLQSFIELIKKDPKNIKFNYNAAVLSLKIWEAEINDKLAENNTLELIKNLKNLGLNPVLYDKLMINFHILRSYYRNEIEDFIEKDRSIDLISKKYKSLNLNENDDLALAKFMVYFDQKIIALDLVESRFKQNNANEELVFYYLNLLFFESQNQAYQKVIKKAASMNSKRFCHLFDSINEGGASFQLLENKMMKDEYCRICQ